MRKSNLRQNHEPFDQSLTRYRSFIEKIINAQRVIASAAEKRDLAESVLLRLCAHWEAFIDEHLVDCVNRDHSNLSDFFGVSIPEHPSKDLCQALLYGNGYRDFRSFGDLKGFSKKILPNDSNPFLQVSAANAKKINEVYKIRNYLSHYSEKARRSLMAMYKSEYQMDRCMAPGQFLLAYRAKRLWGYFDAFQSASAQMKTWCV